MSSFKELGFLSDQMQECKASAQFQYESTFSEAINLCRESMTQLQALPLGEIESGHLMGRSFWWRCMENCQAAIILSDLGMTTSATSPARAAWEYLFYACALWLDPHLEPKVKQKDMFEAGKLLDEIDKHAPHGLTDLKRDDLDKIRPQQKITDRGLSAFDAAKKADLLDLYTVAYRGLSLYGAHSTGVSALRALPASIQGGHDFRIAPEFNGTHYLLENIKMCLMTGMKRLRELTDALNSQSASP